MLTTEDFGSLVRIRATVSLQLESGQRLHSGEHAHVTMLEAQRLTQSGQAVFDVEQAARPLRSCSQRRDSLWMAGPAIDSQLHARKRRH